MIICRNLLLVWVYTLLGGIVHEALYGAIVFSAMSCGVIVFWPIVLLVAVVGWLVKILICMLLIGFAAYLAFDLGSQLCESLGRRFERFF